MLAELARLDTSERMAEALEAYHSGATARALSALESHLRWLEGLQRQSGPRLAAEQIAQVRALMHTCRTRAPSSNEAIVARRFNQALSFEVRRGLSGADVYHRDVAMYDAAELE